MSGKEISPFERAWSAVRQCSPITQCLAAGAYPCANCPFAHSNALLDLDRSGGEARSSDPARSSDGASELDRDTGSLIGATIKAGKAITAENDQHNQVFVLL